MSEATWPALPDPWADGPTEEHIMFPFVWNEPNGRVEGVVRFGPASRDEIGADGVIKMLVPGARPVYLRAGHMRALIEFFQSALERA